MSFFQTRRPDPVGVSRGGRGRGGAGRHVHPRGEPPEPRLCPGLAVGPRRFAHLPGQVAMIFFKSFKSN